MNITELKNIISGCCNDVLFVYNGKRSGVTAEVHDSVPLFQVWHGTFVKEYTKVADLMEDKVFSGKSIKDLADTVEFTIA